MKTQDTQDAQKYPLPYKELVKYLMKKHGIHSGIWGIYALFAFAGINTRDQSGEVFPASVAGLREIGISPFTEESSIAFDAAKLNPKRSSPRKSERLSRKQA